LGNQGKVVCFLAEARDSMLPDRSWSKQIPIPKVSDALPPEVSGRVMKLTTHFHVIPRLKMNGAKPLWTGMTLRFAKGHLYLYLNFLCTDRGNLVRILKHIGREI
jgi:hypothetical protein